MTIYFKPMDFKDFMEFLPRSAEEYAEAMVIAKEHPNMKIPRKLATDEVNGYLTPEGKLRPNEYVHYAYSSEEVDANQKEIPIGILWFSIYHRLPETFAFIAWIEVFEPFRNKGYAKAIMLAVEPLAIALGAKRIDLNVFGHKAAAQKVYAKCGYRFVRAGRYGLSKVPTRFDLSKSLKSH